MSNFNDSCPRCGYKKTTNSALWKSDKNVCGSCGAFWKTINNVDSDVGSYEPAMVSNQTFEQPNTKANEPNDLRASFTASDNSLDAALKPRIHRDEVTWKDKLGSHFTLMNSLSVGLFVFSAVSLLQYANKYEVGTTMASNSVALQTEGGAVSGADALQLDMMTTASVSKAGEDEDLKIGNVHLMRILRGQEVHFMVSGLVRNTSDTVAKDWILKINLMDKFGNIVQEWLHDEDVKNFRAGRVVRFRSSRIASSKKATSANVILIKAKKKS